MKSLYAIFLSRAEVMNFGRLLNSYGITSEIVTAPSCLAVSCSLAVKFSINDINTAKSILSRRNFVGLSGIYEVEKFDNGRLFGKKVY